MEKPAFPLYRRFSGTDTWFEVTSESRFRELKIMPGHFSFLTYEVKILPERHYIHDLIHCAQPGIVPVAFTDFENALLHAKTNLKEVFF